MTDEILIFTDGASRNNPGPSGWGAIIITGNNIEEIGDGTGKSTNNRMELTAALEGLKKTPKASKVKIFTDSSYLINGITKWVFAWARNNYKTKGGGDVLNKDIWKDLYKEAGKRQITWQKVKGHAGIIGNNRADEIATAFADGDSIELFKGSRIHYDLDMSEPTEEQLGMLSANQRSKAKAFSYLSLVEGVLQRHSTWSACEERVKGQSGVKFRKSISREDEEEILEGWGIK